MNGHIIDEFGRHIFVVGPYVLFQKDANQPEYIQVRSDIHSDYIVSYYTSVDHNTWNAMRDLVYF
jgi:hypothetical protein